MKQFDCFAGQNLSLYKDRAYKILSADRAVDVGLAEVKILKNGKKRTVKSTAALKQTIIITFSRKMMEYQRHIRNNQIGRAKLLLRNIDPESYKKGPHDVTRFIKRNSKSKTGEEVTDSYVLNEERIQEEKYDGYYAIATNLERDTEETEADFVRNVLSVNEKRY